ARSLSRCWADLAGFAEMGDAPAARQSGASRVVTALLALMALQFAYRALTTRPGLDTPTGAAFVAWQKNPNPQTEGAWQTALTAYRSHQQRLRLQYAGVALVSGAWAVWRVISAARDRATEATPPRPP